MDWSQLTVAPDSTHHLSGDQPAYVRRFERVQKFHAPGLAPVLSSGKAWHIGLGGEPAYSARYLQTFGYYGGLAAAVDDAGWLHIKPDGQPAYPQRYAWCGNFQEGLCPVRLQDNRYVHIQCDGRRLSGADWSYAGDYRDGVAVVQREDGLSSHVDLLGELIHDKWFVDLDVFHKGFARARDGAGWFHLLPTGDSAYLRRFSMVEPFYNGQARVETHEGALEVIDEAGQTLVQLRPPRRSDVDGLSRDMVGFWRSESIFAAVQSGLMDELPLQASPPASSTRAALRDRLLAALGELGLVTNHQGLWIATPRGKLLRRDDARSMRDAALHWAGAGRSAWSALGDALKTQRWQPGDFFATLAETGDVGSYHAAMRPYALQDYRGFPSIIGSGAGHVVDLGGGTGTLAKLLVDHHPGMRVTVVDRPEVIAVAVKDQKHERVEFKAGDLVAGTLPAGDAFVLARVLHDWDDADARRILVHLRERAAKGTPLYVIEMVKPEQGFQGALLDLHMLLSTGGRERTQREFQRLLSESGWLLKEIHALPAVCSVIVAEAK